MYYTITTTEAKKTYTVETYDEAIRIWEKLKHDIAQTIDSPPDAPARFLTPPARFEASDHTAKLTNSWGDTLASFTVREPYNYSSINNLYSLVKKYIPYYENCVTAYTRPKGYSVIEISNPTFPDRNVRFTQVNTWNKDSLTVRFAISDYERHGYWTKPVDLAKTDTDKLKENISLFFTGIVRVEFKVPGTVRWRFRPWHSPETA